MKKKELEVVINNLEANEFKFAKRVKDDPILSVRLLYIVQAILKFQRDYGYDENGKRKRIRFWSLIFNTEIRRALARIIDATLELFSNDRK